MRDVLVAQVNKVYNALQFICFGLPIMLWGIFSGHLNNEWQEHVDKMKKGD